MFNVAVDHFEAVNPRHVFFLCGPLNSNPLNYAIQYLINSEDIVGDISGKYFKDNARTLTKRKMH